MVKKTLHGHDSESTAYLVDDYPYGRKVRCRIRYWLERDPKKGWRLVSQTEHPTSKVWNKPRKSTYALVAAAMYLDENGHVQWANVHEYTDHAAALTFATEHPQAARASDLPTWAKMKARVCADFATGRRYFTINGVKSEMTEDEASRHLADEAGWTNVVNALESK